MELINIHSTNVQLELDKGKYYIYIIGGWKVSFGDFKVILKKIDSGEAISTDKVFMGMNTFINNKLAKKILSVHIQETAKYQVIFHNPKSVMVKRLDASFLSFLLTPHPNSELNILVSKNNGMSMFKE